MRLFRKYRVGFERIGMVLFVVVATAVLLLHALAEIGYTPPLAGSPDDRKLQAELADACGNSDGAFLAYLCRERVSAETRLNHYLARTDTLTYIYLALALGAVGLLLAGRWSFRWIAEGFTQDGGPAP